MRHDRTLQRYLLTFLQEQSIKLKSHVLSVARETNHALQSATLRVTQLETQIGEQSHLLAEEKSARLLLQSQLLNQTSSDAMSRELKSHADTILDKLYELHADVDEQGGTSDLTEMLEKIVAATQGLNSQQAATVDDVASVKEIVESFSQRQVTPRYQIRRQSSVGGATESEILANSIVASLRT